MREGDRVRVWRVNTLPSNSVTIDSVAGVVDGSGIRVEKACWASDFRTRVPFDAPLSEEAAIAEHRERLKQRIDAHESGIRMAQAQLAQLDVCERECAARAKLTSTTKEG